MKRFFVLAALVSALVLSGCATPAGGDAPAQLLEREQARYAAMVDADIPALAAAIADSVVFTHASGRIDTKESLLTRLGSGDLNYRSIDIGEVSVQAFPDSGVITGTTTLDVLAAGRELKVTMRFTSVWVRESGRWQLVAYQSTRLP